MRALILLVFAASSATAQVLSVADQRRADVQYVATQLPALHANFFFQLNPADFNAAVQTLITQIPNLTDPEFAVRLAQLVALAGDPHTYLYHNGSRFPMTFRNLDDGIFLTGAGQEYASALGMRLVQINGTDIGTVLTQLGTIVPHTSPQWVQFEAQSFLPDQQVLQGLDIAPANGPTPMTFQDGAGNRVTFQVTASPEALTAAPSSEGPLPDFAQNAGQNYWFTYFASERVLYFKFTVCADDPSNPFSAFAARLIGAFDTNAVDSFVMDFRGNTGGDSSVINPVLAGLQQRLPTLLTNANFRIYDVIDSGTFSSGVDIAMAIKSNALALASVYPAISRDTIVIGEASGGPPAGYGEVKGFSLPYLNLSGQYSTVYHPLQAYIPAGTAFNPDVAVANLSTDFFARHDPVLSAIFARSGPTPAAPSGTALVVSAASYRPDQGIAPGSYVAVFGTFPSNTDQVVVNGMPAQIVVMTAHQINIVLPSKTAAGPATISVRMGATEVAGGIFTVVPASIGIFALSTDPSQPGAVLNPDFSVNSRLNPARANQIIQIYGTGFAQSTRVFVGDTPVQVFYSGPVAGAQGLWQINASLPSGLTGQLPLYAIAGNSVSNAVTVWLAGS